MLQRIPLTTLRFRSPTLRALVRDNTRTEASMLIHRQREMSETLSSAQQQQQQQRRHFGSPFASDTSSKPKIAKKKKGHSFVPLKAPVTMTEPTRQFFKSILESKPDCPGILLNYQQSSTGEPRMVFSFDFLKGQPAPEDEAVSLEVVEDGSAKSPADSMNDGLQKLYVHHNAFMKVLGGKLEVDLETLKLTIYDREGNMMDPNA